MEKGATPSSLLDAPSGTYRTLNPATGELIRTFETASSNEAESLLAGAHAAYLEWRTTPIRERVQLFRRMAETIEAHAEEAARLITLEMGKVLPQSAAEVARVADIFRYYAQHGPDLLAEQETAVPGFARAVTRREPVGVVLGIEPWNGPMYQAMRAAAPNLMLGNTVLLKPAEISAGSAGYFEALIAEAGFPEHVYQTALVSISQVSRYIADPRIAAITLTGSDRAGSAVGQQAGQHIKPVVLELGGSDPFIVLDSADIVKAASVAATCRLVVSGQACVSPKRIIVVESVADSFIANFVPLFSDQVVGDPFDSRTTVGPLSTQAAVDLLHDQYQDAKDKGARVLVPGGRVDGPGFYFQPAAISDITPAMRVYSEEAFGPLAMIYRVRDAKAAVELANSSEYGLGGTVFAEDPVQAREVAGLLETGGVGINKYMGAPIEIPFGGIKRSGVGRELGRSGMDSFANIKTYGIA